MKVGTIKSTFSQFPSWTLSTNIEREFAQHHEDENESKVRIEPEEFERKDKS